MLVINPKTAPIVQDIFQWYVYEGMNKNAIARKLIALGIPSPTAYKQQMGMNYHIPTRKPARYIGASAPS